MIDIFYNRLNLYKMNMSVSLSYKAYYKIVVTTASLSIVCHIIGIFSIYVYKKKTNQNTILTYLCLADIACSLHRILSECFLIAADHHKLDSQIIAPVMRGIFYTAMYMMILAYFILTLDRLVCCVNSLMYKVRMTRRRTQIIVIVSLVFSIAMGLATGITKSFWLRQQINWIAIVLGGIGLMTAVSTYCMIIRKVRRSRKQSQRAVLNPGARLKKEFMVPTVLISTYITLYIIPSLIINFYPWPWKGEDEFKLRLVSTSYCVCLVIPQIGAIADAFTFTLLAKHYRDAVIKFFRRDRPVIASHGVSVISSS